MLSFIALIKIITVYLIPISIIPNSPHDDFLFFNLGSFFSEFKWLGPYNNLTLIKGPIFSLFIGFSILLSIPFRIFEALMIVSVSAYFISYLKKINIHTFFLLILFILLIFYPFQYTSVDFRLLRQIIYPWIILMMTVSFSYITYYLIINSISRLNTKIFIHAIIFGASLFLFNYTREEGVWLFPVIIMFLILLIFLSFKKKNLILLFKTLFLSFCTYFLLYIFLISLNFFAYKTTTITEFKNPDYVYGYSSLFLAGIDEDTFYAPSKETWNEIYAVSPSARELKSYIDSDAYSAWSETGCNGLRNGHHRTLRDLDCDNKMVSAFFFMGNKRRYMGSWI